jgi:RimJ/RimL family protein N-acetyltransferase
VQYGGQAPPRPHTARGGRIHTVSGTSHVVLETPRLFLRELAPQDVDGLFEILGDPETMRYYPHPYSREEVARWIERNRERYASHGFGLWALILREKGEFVGDCGLTYQHVDGVDELEVGYHVNKELWRRGLATEAARACRDHAFDALGFDRLIALVRAENEPSSAVATKLGMHVEKETMRGELRHFVFAMTPGDR